MNNLEDYSNTELLRELLKRTDIMDANVYTGYDYECTFDVNGTDVSIQFREEAIEELEAIV